MKIITNVFSIVASLTIGSITVLFAQIYEPEGLNIPGAWNSWTNPPTNCLALASASQVASGKVTLITTGTRRYRTIIHAAASGGDVVGGSYEFLFTSGATASPWANAWKDITVSMNTIQTYNYYSSGGANNSITIANDKWYTLNWKDAGYASTQAVFMETSGEPVTISGASDNYSGAGIAVTVNITLSSAKSNEEHIFVRYTTDTWGTSSFVEASGSGTLYSATIPAGGVIGTTGNQYYILTTTFTSPTHADADMQTINLNNNSGVNYPLPVELGNFSATVSSRSAELRWTTITEANNFGFDIERRFIELQGWNKVGFISGHGSSNVQNEYSFTDHNVAPGRYVYRLKQIDNDGAFKYSQSLELEVGNAAKGLRLAGNFPNPFNPSSVIEYSLAENGMTTLKVYNTIGQEVATLVNEMQEAGKLYRATFNAVGLPSGIYLARLISSNQVRVQKMILMK
jgi:hypothetical protein